jgi:hypothetical protein
MLRTTFIFICLLAANSLWGQSLKKYTISSSGCSAYFFCDPTGTFDIAKTPDSSDVFTCECKNDDISYGTICVRLKDNISDLQAAEGVLVSYLDYLKGSLNIVSAAGYGKGHKLKNRDDTRGMIDYWKDKDGLNWKVKGWTNGKYVCVMYVYTKNEVPETKANVFLDGLLLPGM